MTTPTVPPVDPYGATTPLPRAAATVAAAPAAERTSRGVVHDGLSLSSRIFLAVAGTVLLVLAITLIVGGASSQRAAQNSLDAGLEQTSALITSLLDADEEDMAARTRIFFTNPAYRSEVEKTGVESGGTAAVVDTSDFLDLLTTVLDETGASWAQLTDRNGVRLARSDVPSGEAVDLSESPMISRALNGETVRGFGKTSDTTLFDAVSVPIGGAAAGTVIGVVMVARTIGDSAARRVRQLTGSEAIYFAFDSLDNARIVGVSDSSINREELGSVIPALIRANRASDVDSAAGLREQLMSMQMDSSGVTMAKQGEVSGRSYVWRIRPLLTAAGNPIGGVLTLRDRDQALAPFTRMQRAVLSAGAIALALAFLISFLVARQITQPIRGLVDATRRAAEGDFDARIPPAKGEIGALATAFNLLLEDLREKQALVDFLQGASGGGTVQREAQQMGARVTAAHRVAGAGSEVLSAGQLLANRYEVKKVLGAGGMGMVYKAFDRELGETVAIKTLRPEFMQTDDNALERFRSEIRLARRISHRNVVRTHDIGESDGLYFITMEFVEGSSLKEIIVSRGRLPSVAVLAIGKQLCRALDVAHEAGVIHRDIKPHNMVVEADGTLKVMDFGIARLQSRSDGHTQAGMVVGTPEYMSPEQLRGDELDGRSDLYSAGAVLYEALTGRVPHSADTPATLIGKVLTESPVPPRASVAEVSPLLSSAVMQALEKDRERRPRTALEFLGILDRA